MLLLMLAAVLFALLVGALAFVTGPVGLTMAAAIAAWLLVYAARGVLRARSANRSPGEAKAGTKAGAKGRSSAEAVHRV